MLLNGLDNNMLTREDIERIIENEIRENLEIRVDRDSFEPEYRTVKVLYKNSVVSSDTFRIDE